MRAPLRIITLSALAVLLTGVLYAQPFPNRDLVFNGSNTRLQGPATWNGGYVGFNPAYITVEAWIYPTRTAGSNTIFEDIVGDNNSIGWIMYIQDGKINWRISDDHCCAQNCFSNATIPLNQWTHVAGTYAPDDTARLYINGQLDNAVKGYLNHIGYLGANNEVLSIGANNYDYVSVSSFF